VSLTTNLNHIHTSTLNYSLHVGMRLTKSGKLLGYILAQYIDDDAEDPIRTECVHLYIEDALPKHCAYLHR
jgi:hypothetical protein